MLLSSVSERLACKSFLKSYQDRYLLLPRDTADGADRGVTGGLVLKRPEESLQYRGRAPSPILVPLLQFDRSVDLPLEFAGAGGGVEHGPAGHQQGSGQGPADPA